MIYAIMKLVSSNFYEADVLDEIRNIIRIK